MITYASCTHRPVIRCSPRRARCCSTHTASKHPSVNPRPGGPNSGGLGNSRNSRSRKSDGDSRLAELLVGSRGQSALIVADDLISPFDERFVDR